MKRNLLLVAFSATVLLLSAQDAVIKLNDHCKYRGFNIMEAFQKRSSTNAYQSRDLSL